MAIQKRTSDAKAAWIDQTETDREGREATDRGHERVEQRLHETSSSIDVASRRVEIWCRAATLSPRTEQRICGGLSGTKGLERRNPEGLGGNESRQVPSICGGI